MGKSTFKSIKNFILQPLNLCIIFLSLLALGAIISRSSNNLEILLNISFSLSLIFLINTFVPWLLNYYKFKVLNTKNCIISSIILFLIIDPSQSIIAIAALSIFSLLIRIFVRYKNSPISNPVSAGVVAVLLLNTFLTIKPFISWWGVSYSPRFTDFNISITVVPVLIFGTYLVYKFRKQTIIVTSFILMTLFFILNQIIFVHTELSQLLSIYSYSFFEGTTIFALFVMLIEPKTSPVKKNQQIYFSIIFALVWIILIRLKISNPIIWAILSANLFNFIIKFLSFNKPHKITPIINPVSQDIKPEIKKELPDPSLLKTIQSGPNSSMTQTHVNTQLQLNESPTFTNAEIVNPIIKPIDNHSALQKNNVSLPGGFVVE